MTKLVVSIQKHWLEITIVALLLLTFGTVRMVTASQQQTIIFDEAYWVPDAIIARAEHIDPEPAQPPLVVAIMEEGENLFGNNFAGWRFFSVIAGTLGLLFFYLICRKLALSILPSLISTGLMGISSLYWFYAGHGLSDIFLVVFSMAGLLCYLQFRDYKAGIAAGAATAAKIMGALSVWTLMILALFEGKIKLVFQIMLASIAGYFIICELAYIFINHTFINVFLETYKVLLYTAGAFNLSGVWESPFMWFIKYRVGLYTDGTLMGFQYVIWLCVLPLMLYALWRAIHGNLTGKVVVSWMIGFYFTWCLVSGVIGRGSYYYYELMLFPAVYLAMGLALDKLWRFTNI